MVKMSYLTYQTSPLLACLLPNSHRAQGRTTMVLHATHIFPYGLAQSTLRRYLSVVNRAHSFRNSVRSDTLSETLCLRQSFARYEQAGRVHRVSRRGVLYISRCARCTTLMLVLLCRRKSRVDRRPSPPSSPKP